MNPVWVMVVMFCPGYSDGVECRREVVPGRFQTAVGNLLRRLYGAGGALRDPL